jgi:hypothetical protein
MVQLQLQCRFDPKLFHAVFVLNKVAMGQVSLPELWLSIVIFTPPVLNSHIALV